MSNKTKIEFLESEIAKYDLEIKNTRKEAKRTKIQSLRNNAVFEIETLLMTFLESNNSDFQKLMNRNFDLLINNQIVFKVTAESGGMFSAYGCKLAGKIQDNGFLHMTTEKTNMSITKAYPKSFIGLSNYFGETGIIADKKSYKIIGTRVPESFIGSIDYSGEIRLKTIESYFQIRKSYYIKKIIADPFSGDDTKRAEFLKNRNAMKKIIEETRTNHSY